MGSLAAIIQLLNVAAPGVITLIETIRHKDGTSTTTGSIFVTLDENDAKFDANLAELMAEKAKLMGKAAPASPAKAK